MTDAIPMVELWRGGRLESRHMGHAVVVHADDGVIASWGEPETLIYPRSSCKMIQALPLLESGAAEAAGLTEAQLALACASHSGARLHTDMVETWLATLGLREEDLRCGCHMPGDEAARNNLIREDRQPCQIHNNCSGKHSGFLTLNRHLGGGPEYVEPDHPVQRAVKEAFEATTGLPSPGYGIDGCSAPNFATTVTGLARAMAFFAGANPEGSLRERAAARLHRAMAAHPELVAGEGRACTELMRAMEGKVAIKTGAEAVFVAILPEQRLGVALKIVDGGTRGSEAAITALLVHLGVLDGEHPAARKRLNATQSNWRGLETGIVTAATGFPA
ncbi:L-asparaginase [Haematobacter missouriensis]|uniref:L-asparaginase n=1 Tax=Haematobacter missouriensis TaxID=366616 RepID=A0A212AXE6_9RHOB|nr:asparaginase [Haematobacter missouriensis]KFI34179.1 L-asparaginase [Haematobacter missouriensis]OWJ72314.1 L-asparaginase [Haematobacter missouriensis]OWJ86163.1 L-asparaginase [Haematobacter missouriensis]